MTAPAWAQTQLPAAPQPGAAPVPVASESRPPTTREAIGQPYSVELHSGTSFIGILQNISYELLTFSVKELGTVIVQRTNLRQLTPLTAEQARRGYDDVGNGTRLLFGPTARNLRRGEGYVQSAYVFLVGVNYGITDNFSIGALFTAIPSAGSENLFSITPKLSVPVGRALRVGAGAVLGATAGGTFGVTYANGTYGNANNNLTVGLGYGFANGSFASTPVFVLGGATRITRRVSLMNENYLFHTKGDYSQENYLLGIAGVRIAAQRLSGSLGILYTYYSRDRGANSGYSSSSGIALPYAEVSYRFGRPR